MEGTVFDGIELLSDAAVKGLTHLKIVVIYKFQIINK